MLALYANPRHFGGNLKNLSTKVGCIVLRHFMHLLVNHLMESDRILLDDGIAMFVGTIKNHPDGIAKRHKKRQIYWENPGYRYGIVLTGLEHEYLFRMPFRRRQELAIRIQEGQNFYNQLQKTA